MARTVSAVRIGLYLAEMLDEDHGICVCDIKTGQGYIELAFEDSYDLEGALAIIGTPDDGMAGTEMAGLIIDTGAISDTHALVYLRG
jgi:hypothetical protein